MDIEILGLIGFAFAATTLARVAYKRRLDVLYGPYVQGRPRGFSLARFWHPASSAIDRLLLLEGQKMFASASAG
jgi:hypothetical protein